MNNFSTLDLTQRNGRLNALLQINAGTRYLEIGVSKGETFHKVAADFKVAVDPRFLFDFQSRQAGNTRYFQCSSDEYFSRHSRECGKFDLIYLDGLHTFEQTFRDLLCSISLIHDRSLILIDDTMPTNFIAGESELSRHLELRTITGIPDQSWMGDVYKIVIAVHDFMPLWSYVTFPGHGQTILFQRPRENFVPVLNSLFEISRISYTDFLLHRKAGLFNVAATPRAALAQVEACFEAP